MRAIFFGTPAIAVPSLRALADVAEVTAVVCQPDRPAGRGMKLRPPPVKEAALELGLPVHQPTKVRNQAFADWVTAQQTDVALVIAYGRILSQRVLDGPRRGCMNLHASILPRYRGAAPINWAIVHGETETGIALMQMDAGMDTGPVFTTRTLPIGPDETAGELAERLGQLAAVVVREDLPAAVNGTLRATPQDHDAATMAPMMSKEDGRIDWSQPAKRVHDHARGMTPWPGAHTTLDGKRFKVLATRRLDTTSEATPGTVVDIATSGEQPHAVVSCGEGCVALLRGQLAGKKALDAGQLAAGRTIAVGTVLGT
ncbi:MAG TPA: methionyl-tRNA formyltransferase [Polyangiaceae bacterium]|nr:methionyl-tRNA formyltransferase [Polyangiaceae bacterium]